MEAAEAAEARGGRRPAGGKPAVDVEEGFHPGGVGAAGAEDLGPSLHKVPLIPGLAAELSSAGGGGGGGECLIVHAAKNGLPSNMMALITSGCCELGGGRFLFGPVRAGGRWLAAGEAVAALLHCRSSH